MRRQDSALRIDVVMTAKLGAMDSRFELHGIGFVWDDDKARRNAAKHGVRFEQAAEAFFEVISTMPQLATQQPSLATGSRQSLPG